LTPVSSSWSAARATRCGTVSILTSCSTNRTPDACQPTQVVDACRSILERWAEPADLLVAKVSPGLSVGHCKRGFRCIGCILILVSELRGHTGGTWISRSPIHRSRAPYRAAGQPSRAHQAGHPATRRVVRLAPTATKTQSLGIRSPREVMPFPQVRSRVRAANEGCRGRRRDAQAPWHVRQAFRDSV
jgi:hypothetical protein